jgi:hypothetical protein
MNAKFLTLCCVGLITWTGLGEVAQAQQAAPPIGVWMGKDGPVDVTLSVSGNGTALYNAGGQGVVGRWTWAPTSPAGGIITIHYQLTGNPQRLYYSITYRGPDRIQLSDPYFSIPMNRR